MRALKVITIIIKNIEKKEPKKLKHHYKIMKNIIFFSLSISLFIFYFFLHLKKICYKFWNICL